MKITVNPILASEGAQATGEVPIRPRQLGPLERIRTRHLFIVSESPQGRNDPQLTEQEEQQNL